MRQSPLVVGLALALAACAASGPKPSAPPLHPPLSTPAIGASARTDPRARMVASATAMIGQPSRYGGSAPGGFDCSGLVVYAANSIGLHVPRTAQEQLHAGVLVARRDVQAGDLVFMHLKRKELHVGIALDADRFVHAPSTGGVVRIDSLTAQPYARGFIRARRVIDTIGATSTP